MLPAAEIATTPHNTNAARRIHTPQRFLLALSKTVHALLRFTFA
jgi:hypothetical protein